MERGQFTFYRSFWEAVKELPPKGRTEVICAVCEYVFEESNPQLSGVSKAVFSLIKPTLDTAARKAANGKLGGSKHKANSKQKENKKEIEGEKEKEKEIERENDSSPPISPPGKPTKHKHGEFGWVKLTDDEYAKLLADLGEHELDRCITVVDESAQQNGNRNGWKDWNLVVRKCNREGWGMKQERRDSYGLSGNAATGNQGNGSRWNVKSRKLD